MTQPLIAFDTAPAILAVPPFSALCNAAFALRREVFVWEQRVPPEIEMDEEDFTATHVVAVLQGEAVGTLRLLDKPDTVKIGRVAVKRDWRGHGIAKAMMLFAMESCRAAGRTRFSLAAQTDKLGFYEKLGFVAHGPEFDDAGMPHRAMTAG